MYVCPDGSPVQTQELATTLSKYAWLRSQLWVQAVNIYIRKQQYIINKKLYSIRSRHYANILHNFENIHLVHWPN